MGRVLLLKDDSSMVAEQKSRCCRSRERRGAAGVFGRGRTKTYRVV